MRIAVQPEALAGSAGVLLGQADKDPMIAGQLAAASNQRWAGAEDLRELRTLSVCMPQLPDTEITEVYDRIVEAESQVVGPARRRTDYSEGTATYNDELLVAGEGSILLEAQHATDPVRKATGKREGADHGTGGLGLVLAEDAGGRIGVLRGRQTGNANVNPEHPLKSWLLAEAGTGRYDRFFSVHGMLPGKVTSLRDITEIHAVAGLGLDPTEADYEAAERLQQRAKTEYGLRVVIGNLLPHISFAQDPDWDKVSFRDLGDEPVRNADGAVTAARVAAMMPNSTVTFMRQQTGLPASQLEISRSLRLMPVDVYRRDPKAEAVGVYLGYQLCRLALEPR